MLQTKPSETHIKKALQEYLERHLCTYHSSWVHSLFFELDHNTNLTISFPHHFFADWFALNLQNQFEAFIRSHYPAVQSITYKLRPPPHHFLMDQFRYSYDSDCLIENCLYNQKNKATYVSALRFVEQNTQINPFVLCGDKGAGKTHLIKAMANEYIQKKSIENILYIPFHDLIETYISTSISQKEIREQFKPFHLVLIEDIHLMGENPSVQQECLYLYEYLYEHQISMMFTCTGKLATMPLLDKSLRSRLESGLLLYLHRPDLDVRIEYIQRQCALYNIPLGKKNVLGLAQKHYNFSTLETSLTHLFDRINNQQESIEDLDVQKFLPLQPCISDSHVDFEHILDVVAGHFQISSADILSKSRKKDIVFARQVAMYLCRSILQDSFTSIGSHFGGRDHSTVIYSIEKIKKLQNNHSEIDNLLTQLVTLCQNR
jgi:chromosomal replication initiator protein